MTQTHPLTTIRGLSRRQSFGPIHWQSPLADLLAGESYCHVPKDQQSVTRVPLCPDKDMSSDLFLKVPRRVCARA